MSLCSIANLYEVAGRLTQTACQAAQEEQVKNFVFALFVADGDNQVQRFVLEQNATDQQRQALSCLTLETRRPREPGFWQTKITGSLVSYKNTSLESIDNRIFYLFFLSENKAQDSVILDVIYEQFLEFVDDEHVSTPLLKPSFCQIAAEVFFPFCDY